MPAVYTLTMDADRCEKVVRRLLDKLDAQRWDSREAAVEALALELQAVAMSSALDPDLGGAGDDASLADELNAIPRGGLSDFEAEFVSSLGAKLSQYGSLTPKQRALAKRILERRGGK